MKIKNNRIIIETNSLMNGCITCRRVSYSVDDIRDVAGISAEQIRRINDPHEILDELNNQSLSERLKYLPEHVIRRGFTVQ